MGHQRISEVGKRYGKLLVTAYAETDNNGCARFHCRCDCGETCTRAGSALRGGKSTKCDACISRVRSAGQSKRMRTQKHQPVNLMEDWDNE